MGAVLTFLLEHLDLIELLAEAINGGVKKDDLRAAIRKEMVAASDAEMRRELGG
jgi:hypothetical protein